MLVIYTNLSSR